MKLSIYEGAVLWHPNEKQEEDGATSRLIVSPTGFLARDAEHATALMGRRIPDEVSEEESQLEVVVRPFRSHGGY